MPKPQPTLQDVLTLAHLILHKHYCENDVESIIALLDPDVVWMGAAEDEYAQGRGRIDPADGRPAGGTIPRPSVPDRRG